MIAIPGRARGCGPLRAVALRRGTHLQQVVQRYYSRKIAVAIEDRHRVAAARAQALQGLLNAVAGTSGFCARPEDVADGHDIRVEVDGHDAGHDVARREDAGPGLSVAPAFSDHEVAGALIAHEFAGSRYRGVAVY